MNPFDHTRISDPEHFLDRSEDRARLLRLIQEGRNILVYGPRRLGKTSLLRRVSADLGDRYVPVMVECLLATDEATLADAIMRRFKTTRYARLKRFMEDARRAAKGIEVGIEVTADGAVPFVRAGTPPGRSLDDVLEFLTRVAAAGDRRIVLVLDEFQTVMEWGKEPLIAKFRAHAQAQRHVQYIISGSRPSVLRGLTRHRSPFWRQLTEFPVAGLRIDDLEPDLQKRLGWTVGGEARALLDEACGANTQRLMQVLGRLWRDGHTLEPDPIRDAVDACVEENRSEYERVVESLKEGNQKRVLVALAIDPPEHPTGSDFVQRHGLKSGPHVLRAITRLRELEILDEGTAFQDPLMRVYIRSVLDAGGP